jgi:hypothetical protein
MFFLKLSLLLLPFNMENNSKSPDSIPQHVEARLKTILPGFTTYGFNLNGMSANPNVFIANRDAIVLKYSEKKYYLFATYNFDPRDKSLGPKVKNAFDSVKVVMIKHSLVSEDSSQPFHPIPDWLTAFNNIECLILDNILIERPIAFEYFNLKLLAFRNTQVKDMTSLIKVLGTMRDLEFLMHQSVFSATEIDRLKISLPQLFVLNLPTDKDPPQK